MKVVSLSLITTTGWYVILQPASCYNVNRRDAVGNAAKAAAATTASASIVRSSWALELEQTAYISDDTVAATVPVPTVKMGSLDVSKTIQGYWQLAGGHGRYKSEDAIQNMRAHYEAGITTMDTADIYGPSESIVGQFVKEELAKNTQPPPMPNTKFCCFI